MQLVFWQEVLLIKDFITHLFHSSTVIGCYRFFHSILLFCSLHLFWNYGPPYCNCPSEGGGGWWWLENIEVHCHFAAGTEMLYIQFIHSC